MSITNVTKIEVSAETQTMLISSDEGPTVFVYQPHWNDADVVRQYAIDDSINYSRSYTYEVYKADASDWRTIYGV